MDVAWMFLKGLLASGITAVLVCAAPIANDDSQPVTDEALRLVALRAIFPGMRINIDPRKKIDDSWPEKPKGGELFFPDALARESVYSVFGKAMNRAEEWASGDAITGKLSTDRLVRFQLFRWPNERDSGLLAVLQYDFPSASPAMSCPSIGLLVHLVRDGAGWAVKDRYLLETVHHHTVQAIRLMDLAGRGADELVVESNFGGAGTAGSSLQVFDLSRGSFDEVAATESRMQYMTEDWYTQALDISRTRASHGQEFCFSRTALFENGEAFRPPRVTHPCYKRGEGIDSGKGMERNKMLVPLR
jgi:hypothetical protein